jgi:Protein of unknown function (DUF995)
MNMITRTLLALTAAASLSACASMNVFKDSTPDPQASVLAPEQDLAPAPATALSSAQIKALLTGKSWRWTGPKNSGVTLYALDGTSLVEVTGKGTTGGKWVAKDGQLCESFSPASFIPQGVPMACQSFTGSGGNYRVGQATFTIAS